EMRWAFSWEAVVVGVAVFVFWVGLDPRYPHFVKADRSWNPNADFGVHTPLALGIILFRILGSTLIVPPLEEVFFRSFLYRYILKADFLSIPLNTFNPRAFIITSLLFGLEHGG